jgi:hypothetical protein
MGGLPPTNKIRARAIRVGPSQRLPGCALDGMLRRALAFGGCWNHSDGLCKRFAKCEEMEKAGAETQEKRRRREKYWRVLLALKQFPRGDPVSNWVLGWRHDEDCFIVCSPRPSSMTPTPHAASCHGVRFHAVPVALVGECSISVVSQHEISRFGRAPRRLPANHPRESVVRRPSMHAQRRRLPQPGRAP